MRQQYYVAMHYRGHCVPSSAIANGNLTNCRASVRRMMNKKDRAIDVSWHIYKCVDVEDTPQWARFVE